MLKVLPVVVFLCLFKVASAQWQDCSTALIPDSARFFVPRPAEGFGKIRELRQGKIPDFRAFPAEKNSTWILFRISSASNLTFSICPQFSSDDYDFMLFQEHSGNFCDSSKNLSSLKVVRSCISRNDASLNGCTGLAEKDSLECIPIGRGPSFAAPAALSEGNYFLTVASNKKLKGGFYFEYSLKSMVKTAQDSLILAYQHDIKAPKNTLYISASDTSSSVVLKTSWMVQSFSGKNDTITDSLRALIMPWREKTMITAMAVGFLPLTKLFSPQADSLSITDTFRLKRILPDSMMVLSYVFFEGNTDQILPESAPALQALLKFLNDNPTVKIEIQGHVNAPGRKNSRSLRKLSEARAYAIKKFLTFNDVRKNRIRTEGFGNERMLFPDPQTPTESEQNRRVEVKIISVGD